MLKSIGILLIACGPILAQDAGISAERIREHTRYLSSDLLEGRGVGVRGGQLATEYIATQLALAGAKPAGDAGTYFQNVPLVGLETQPNATLTAAVWGKSVEFHWLDDFVGVSQTQRPDTRFEAGAVFVGHGITAPEWKWDDFKGVDVTGKVLVMFTNEPASDDPKFFDGRALTYYGRWTYKYEEALRRGARGAILIHTTPTASYGWNVVRNSWARESPSVKLAAGAKSLSFQGWITREAGERMLALAGRTVDELLAAAEKPDFKPIDLDILIRAHMPTRVRDLETRNVAAIVPGSDARLKDEVVIYSAHWDHLGVGAPVAGDAIYNGAIDNATGCAILLELARAWSSMGQKPRRSALFLAVTAEEGGLKGSEYYAAHPVVAAAKTAIDLNYDALYPWGRAKDVVLTGAERTTVWPLAQQIARRLNLEISPEAQPEAGYYFRSDHFSFAHVGIPAFSIGRATEFAGKAPGFGEKAYQEYNSKHYHQPSDEFQADWDFTALQQAAEYGFLLGKDIANQDRLPDWRPGDQFHR
ncbi:MAG: M20/M25/M40 family metallo-hydrolase [Acidobacteriia bacterium]|nr:M20/M25/M40 family metallo-hydrolase [Terriglobia bacterium]